MTPRIPPLPPEEWGEDVRPLLEAEFGDTGVRIGDNNIFSTLARSPDLYRAFMRFGGYLLGAGKLPPRERELLILRTGLNCGSDYEWGQHVRISELLGISREEIDRVASGPEAFEGDEALLLRAADELHADARISDATWEGLTGFLDEEQLIELPVLVGQYHLVAFTLNSLGVELDEGLEGLPDQR